MSHLEKSYKKIQNRVQQAQLILPEKKKVRLLAVSKKQKASQVEALFRLGQKEFAENYLQELEEKARSLRPLQEQGLSWVFIGRLQSNKIKKIVSFCSEIQSLESREHARKIASAARDLGKVPYPVYLLVNLASEGSKGGLLLEEVEFFAKALEESFPELRIEGLMSIPPRFDLSQHSENDYRKMYELLAQKSRRVGKGKLSLGMSGDLELAVESGSDCVRVGTALFGPRDS